MATSPQRAILLLSCPEQKGIVAAVSDFLYRNDGNIVDADQHTDFESNLFLQRIEWEVDGFRLPREAVAEAFRAAGRALLHVVGAAISRATSRAWRSSSRASTTA
jgi:formyltetrahydrofolate hydrolase